MSKRASLDDLQISSKSELIELVYEQRARIAELESKLRFATRNRPAPRRIFKPVQLPKLVDALKGKSIEKAVEEAYLTGWHDRSLVEVKPSKTKIIQGVDHEKSITG